MPPIRRYLRITKYSVLECRIYLDNPADVHRWLLNTAAPVLPRVINAVRPLVLPKLREENARAKSNKGNKKKGWKDVVVEDDFEVAVFLTEVSARHTLLRKEKTAKSEKARLGTVDGKLTGSGSMEMPVEVEDGSNFENVQIGVESPEEQATDLKDIPMAKHGEGSDSAVHTPASEQSLFVSDDSAEDGISRAQRHPGAGEVHGRTLIDGDDGGDDKKKMSLHTSYDGFAIYGRILCLVVKRRGGSKGKDRAGGSGQAMMEEWIASTQLGEEQLMEG